MKSAVEPWPEIILLWTPPIVLALGCGPALTPRLQDAPAPRDYARELSGDSRPCDHRVELLRTRPLDEGDYVLVATLSATCYPGAPGACEQSLLHRACELNAEIVVLRGTSEGATPPGASGQSLSSMTAHAMRRKGAVAAGRGGPEPE